MSSGCQFEWASACVCLLKDPHSEVVAVFLTELRFFWFSTVFSSAFTDLFYFQGIFLKKVLLSTRAAVPPPNILLTISELLQIVNFDFLTKREDRTGEVDDR